MVSYQEYAIQYITILNITVLYITVLVSAPNNYNKISTYSIRCIKIYTYMCTKEHS